MQHVTFELSLQNAGHYPMAPTCCGSALKGKPCDNADQSQREGPCTHHMATIRSGAYGDR